MRKRFNSKILNEILKAFSPFYIGWNHHLSSYFLLSSFPNHCYIYNYVSSPSLLHILSHTSSKILKTIQNYYCHLHYFFSNNGSRGSSFLLSCVPDLDL